MEVARTESTVRSSRARARSSAKPWELYSPRWRTSAGSPGLSPLGFGLSERTVGSSVVVSVTGELDSSTAPQLSRALGAALGRGAKGLVCDLTGVSFLGAAGMTTLLLARRRALASQTWLDLVCPQPTPRRVIALLGLDALLSPHYRVSEAVDAQAHRGASPGSRSQITRPTREAIL